MNKGEIMNIKYEDIEKKDAEVRKLFPTAQILRLGNKRVAWLDGYRSIASLDVSTGKMVFSFKKDQKRKRT